MADCEHYQELLSLYVDGETAPDKEAALLAHLKTCPDCAALLAVYSEVSRLLSDGADPPEALAENVMRRVREQREGRLQRGIRMRRTVLRIAATAACAALLLIPLSTVLRNAGAKKNGADVAMMYSASGRCEDVNASEPSAESYDGLDDGLLNDICQKSAVGDLDADSSAAPSSADTPDYPTPPDMSMPEPEPCEPSGDPVNESPSTDCNGFDKLESAVSDYAAVVYAESCPEELGSPDARAVYTLPDGSRCVEITLAELALLEEAGYRVEPGSESAELALVTFPE